MARTAQIAPGPNDKTEQRLRKVLKRLCAERSVLSAERNTPAENGLGLVRRVIDEIDETILPRRIDIVAGGKVVGRMIASHRRLIALDTAHPAPEGNATPEGMARAHVETLVQIGDSHPQASLCCRGRIENVATDSQSCSVEQLAACTVAHDRAAPLDRFLGEIEDRAQGWIRLEERTTILGSGGSGDLVARLADLGRLVVEKRMYKGSLSRLKRSEPTCSVLPFSRTLRAVVASDSDDYVIALLHHEDVAGTLADWQRFYGAKSPASP